MIELLVAATIIAVLSMIGVVSYTSLNQRARDGKRKADLSQVQAALELYRSDNGAYPAGSYADMTSVLVNADYLASPAPVDPKNEDTFVYTYSAGTTTTYELCAELETGDDSEYCVENP